MVEERRDIGNTPEGEVIEPLWKLGDPPVSTEQPDGSYVWDLSSIAPDLMKAPPELGFSPETTRTIHSTRPFESLTPQQQHDYISKDRLILKDFYGRIENRYKRLQDRRLRQAHKDN